MELTVAVIGTYTRNSKGKLPPFLISSTYVESTSFYFPTISVTGTVVT